MARKINSEIRILQSGDWTFRGEKIIQEDILNYFKKNLQEDENGIYIDNRFGELAENGYVQVEGFPLQMTDRKSDGNEAVWTSETGDEFPEADIHIFRGPRNILFAKTRKDALLKYKIPIYLLSSLSAYLEESPEGFYFAFPEGRKEVINFDGEIIVPLPKEYK